MAIGGTKKVRELELEIEALKSEVGNVERQRASEKASLQAAIESELRQKEELKAKTEAAVGAMTDLTTRLEASQAEVAELAQVKASLKGQVESCQITIASHVKDLETRAADIQNLKQERRELEEKREAEQKELRATQVNASRSKSVEVKMSEELTLALSRAAEAEAKVVQATDAAASVTSALREELALRDERWKAAQLEHRAEAQAQADLISELRAQVQADAVTSSQLREEIVLLSMIGETTTSSNAKHSLKTHAQERHEALKAQMLELKREVFDKSQALVTQGEKHFKFKTVYEKLMERERSLAQELDAGRKCLLQGISGPDVDVSLYQHIGLVELIRLRLQSRHDLHEMWINQNDTDEEEEEGRASPKSKSSKSKQAKAKKTNPNQEGTEILGSLGKLEREMRVLRSRNKKLVVRVQELEQELECAVSAMDDVKVLRGKAAELAGRQRNEKGLRSKFEFAAKENSEQVLALSEHIEKLMVHLKHEAAAKARAEASTRRLEREMGQIRNRTLALTAKIKAKDRLVMEMRDGSKILEDQLRLLDEKQIDLRTKLDWARSSSSKEVKRLQEDAGILRTKWQMAMDLGLLSSSSNFEVDSIMKQLGKKKQPSSDQQHKVDPSNSPTRMKQDPRSQDAFQIPTIPEKNIVEPNMPWSNAKLSSLQHHN